MTLVRILPPGPHDATSGHLEVTKRIGAGFWPAYPIALAGFLLGSAAAFVFPLSWWLYPLPFPLAGGVLGVWVAGRMLGVASPGRIATFCAAGLLPFWLTPETLRLADYLDGVEAASWQEIAFGVLGVGWKEVFGAFLGNNGPIGVALVALVLAAIPAAAVLAANLGRKATLPLLAAASVVLLITVPPMLSYQWGSGWGSGDEPAIDEDHDMVDDRHQAIPWLPTWALAQLLGLSTAITLLGLARARARKPT